MRPSTLFLAVLAGGYAVLALLLAAHPLARDGNTGPCRKQVRELGLTDLCLFTEARYTRHISLADLHSAFQDHPGALDHFPSGSLVRPPVEIWFQPWRDTRALD